MKHQVLLAIGIGVAAVVAAASAVAQQPSAISPAATSVNVGPGESAIAYALVGASVQSLTAGVDGAGLTVKAGGCDDTMPTEQFVSVTPQRASPSDVGLATVCVGASATSKGGRVVLVGHDGSSAAVTVTVTSTAAPQANVAPPGELQIVIEGSDDTRKLDAAFALGSTLEAVASGPNGVATVYLSREDLTCREAKRRATSTITATVDAAPAVHVVVCGARDVGKYEATFDLNGAAENGDLTVTVVRRRPPWVALLPALAGLFLALLANRKLNKAAVKAAAAVDEKAREAAEASRKKIEVDLRAGGIAIANLLEQWEPRRWSALTDNRASDDPSLAEATKLYASAAACVAPLVALVRHHRQSSPPGRVDLPIVNSAVAELTFGISPRDGGFKPADVVARLRTRAAAAEVAVAEDLRLRHALADQSLGGGLREQLRQRQARLGAATLDRVNDVMASPIPPENDAALLESSTRSSRKEPQQRAPISVTAPPPAGAPAPTPPRPSAARLALESTLAKWVAFIIGVMLAVLVGVQDALDPAAAWGTTADLVKILTAAATLPTLLDQARKLISGGPAATR